MAIGILTFLGIFSPKIGLVGAGLAIIMTFGTLSFLVTTPEVWVPNLGSGEFGFPLLSGAGRLVIKDTAILAGAIVVLSVRCQRILKKNKRNKKKGKVLAIPFFLLVTVYSVRYSGLRRSSLCGIGSATRGSEALITCASVGNCGKCQPPLRITGILLRM